MRTNINAERGKWKKDYKKWTADHKKWSEDHKKLLGTLKNLQGIVTKHGRQMKEFDRESGKTVKHVSNLNGKQCTTAACKRLKNLREKQGVHHRCHAQAHKNLQNLTRQIARTVKTIS